MQLLAIAPDPRRDLANLGEPEGFEAPDIGPAEVEFVPARRQLRRGAVSVVIVMQLFAADHDAPRHDVATGILGGKVTVAPVMAEAVDDPGGSNRDPGHLHRPDGQPDRAAK